MSDEHLALSIDEQVNLLMSGSEFGDAQLGAAMAERLRQRLKLAAAEGRPLRVYAGYDPSAPDLHLGHSITLRRLRLFQQLGHHVTVVVGTVTAMVGDTSDRASGRPRRSADEVEEAAQTYGEQSFTILDRHRTEVLANGDWLRDLALPEVLELASQFTVQQFLARDNYRRRIDRGQPVGLHEFLYALLQGYDAVHLHTDVQLGGTEQLFSILAGAKLQEAFGQPPCVAITFPILLGTDGSERMSKSKGNYVGLTEPANQQFGKVMSISDDTMLQWVDLVSGWAADEVDRFREAMASGELRPMEAKKQLAHRIVELYHSDQAATDAEVEFERTHQRHLEPAALPEVRLALPLALLDVLVELGAASSKSAAGRLIAGGGVCIDGDKTTAREAILSQAATIKVGPHRFYRVTST